MVPFAFHNRFLVFADLLALFPHKHSLNLGIEFLVEFHIPCHTIWALEWTRFGWAINI
jgi:hypothetical protein